MTISPVRPPHGERALVDQLRIADLDVGDRHGRLGGTVRVRDAGTREPLAQSRGRGAAQSLAAEQEQAHVGQQGFVEAAVGQAQVGERRRGRPHFHARIAQVGEQRAQIFGLLAFDGVQAAAGGERAHHLVLGQVERVRRLVQEYAPALADHGKRANPVHEARNVVRTDLDALRATRGTSSRDQGRRRGCPPPRRPCAHRARRTRAARTPGHRACPRQPPRAPPRAGTGCPRDA